MQIEQVIYKDNKKFKKVFNMIWDCLGVWVFGICQYGVIYVLKFVLYVESLVKYCGK